VVNVGRSPTDRTLVDQIASTIQDIFPSVYIVDGPGSFNSMIYATRMVTAFSNLAGNLIMLKSNESTPALLLDSLQVALVYHQPTPPMSVVYTDDWAPIEWVTNKMVLSYVIFGDLNAIGH
jgi:hypothetical protein